jgi:hypothetical protein
MDRSAHPDDLLAEYVDGSLGPGHRARVEAHMDGCERCRKEVALATEARAALGELPDVAAPPGLELAVRRRGRAPSRALWVGAGVAAAAAAILAGAVFIFGPAGRPAGGGGGSAVTAPQERGVVPAPQGEAAGAGAPVPTIKRTDKDYTPASLATLGRRLRDRARASLRSKALASTADRYYRAFDIRSLTPRVRDVVECVFREVPPEQKLVPYAVQEASFDHEPAYVAAFLQGPSPSTPYDRVLIWVVDRQSCQLRYYAAQRL